MSTAPGGGINSGMIDSMNRAASSSGGTMVDIFKTLTGISTEVKGFFSDENFTFSSAFSINNIKGLFAMFGEGMRGNSILSGFFDMFESREEMFKHTMGMGFSSQYSDSGSGSEGGGEGGDAGSGSNRVFSGLPGRPKDMGEFGHVYGNELSYLSPDPSPGLGIGGIGMGMG